MGAGSTKVSNVSKVTKPAKPAKPAKREWDEVQKEARKRPNLLKRVGHQKASATKYKLGDLRRLLGVSQVELAELTGRTQSAISQMEAGHINVTVETLRTLIEQLGGELHILVALGDQTIELDV
jgi:DNA-binding XRE family transcriptional regulator